VCPLGRRGAPQRPFSISSHEKCIFSESGASKSGVTNSKEYFLTDVREEHHFKRYSINIQLDELFQLFNQRDLNKSIIACGGTSRVF
jgi:hypothetical protein